MAEGTEQGNVVKEFSIGNTRVKICDDFCRNMTRADVERILARIASRAYEHLSAPAATTPCAK